MQNLKLAAAIKISGLKKSKICQELGITYTALENWLAGKSLPRLDNAYKLANMLGKEVEDIFNLKEPAAL